jgi:hypothetical protein
LFEKKIFEVDGKHRKLCAARKCATQVTDYAEEMEILSTGNELEAAIVTIRNKQAQKTAEKLARERELAKVGVRIFSAMLGFSITTYLFRVSSHLVLY